MRDPHNVDTRRRLLLAAGEVFAEHGFRKTTVRQVCQKARANIAAVNYHFGDKAGLYAAVLNYTHRLAIEKYPPTLGLTDGASAEQRLRAVVRNLLLRLFDPEQPPWHGMLMAREMIEPTAALETMISESIRPRYELLLTIVRELLGPGAHEEQARLCVNSVVGQCLYYRHAWHLLARLQPQQRFDPADIERLADHIANFSLGALRQLALTSQDARS